MDNMLQNRLETCFKSIANKENHKLDFHFMKRTLLVYNYDLENKEKDSLRNLTSFLQHCEKGRWCDAVSFYSAALKEYEKEYVKTKTSHSTKEIPKSDATEATSSKLSIEEPEKVLPLRASSVAQPPKDKFQTSLNHAPDKSSLTLKIDAALSNQGFSVEKPSRNTGEHDSRDFKGTKLYHLEFHKDKNKYRMTSDNNDKSTRQKATPMEKGLSAPDYYTESESRKLSIKEPEKVLPIRASSVDLRDPHSLVHDRRNKSDHTLRVEFPKTGHGPNEVDIYRRNENASILLRDNNPNIADVSDINRSIKLTERFSELYSDERIDAFEELVKCHRDRPLSEHLEKEIVEDLLRVVKHAYDHCQQWNEKIENKLKTDKQTKPLKSEDERIQFKGQQLERKKKLVEEAANDVVQKFMEKEISNLSPRHASTEAKSKFIKYAKATVEIVWWMCVQTPPVYLEYAESGPFVSDSYRSYTKSGRFVAFCVWPLVLLHKDGPILSKGIAQGTDVQHNSK